jgi:hypothetical protein
MANVSKRCLEYDYAGKVVAAKWYVHKDCQTVRTVLFMGAGQSGWQARALARRLRGAAVILMAPHWHAAADGKDIRQFMNRFTFVVMDKVSQKSSKQICVMADSQAVPGVVSYALAQPGRVAQLVLLQPLGLNREAFGKTPADRLREFRRRLRANYLQVLPRALSDSRWSFSQLSLAWSVARHSLHKKRAYQYASGLSHSISEELSQLEGKVPVKILIGADDKLFPPAEIKASLTSRGLEWADIIIVPGIAHSPLNSKDGEKLWAAANISGVGV